MMDNKHAHHYRADIDGLRAIAVISVVFFHFFPSVLPGGFVGVDIFFVISGFLITGIIARSIRNNNFSITEFYIRRANRIFPSLCLMLIAVLIAGSISLFPDEFQRLGKHIFAGSTFTSNFALWNESGYFDTAAEVKPLLHLWSLGIEEQFYLFWPLLLLFARSERRQVLVVSAVLGFSFVTNLLFIHRFPGATFYLPHTRVWELAAGGMGALVFQKIPKPRPVSWSLLPQSAFY